MKYRVLFTFIFIVLVSYAKGQEYSIVSFEPALKDLTARAENTSRIDGNGRKCAVIKVYADDKIATVRGNAIGEVSSTGMEKWIYLSHDSKDMEIVFEHHYPLHITFIDYDIPTVTGQMTYILKLKEDKTANTSETNSSHVMETHTPNQTNNRELTFSEMYKKGKDAYEKSDYAEAIIWFRRAAEGGYAVAQIKLGWMYLVGEDVEQDYSEALKWYRKAAEQGDAEAQYNLGMWYFTGSVVEQDYSEALKWYRKAAEQGDATAQNNLGWMYQNGYGTGQDYSEALKWYTKAAEHGDLTAQNNLGWMYQNGYGTGQDYSEALKWYRKAAENGNLTAQNNLGWMYFNGNGVKQDYSEALKWYSKAAEQGDASAQHNLGWMYEYGQGVSKDKSEARKWYEKAAAQGQTNATERLKNL